MTPLECLSSLAFDFGLVIFDPSSNSVLAYSESAAIVWRALESDGSLESAAVALAGTFGISESQAVQDASTITQHWREAGMLKNSDSTPPLEPIANPVSVLELGTEKTTDYRIHGKNIRTVIAEQSIVRHLETLLAPFIIDGFVAQDHGEAAEFIVRLENNVLKFFVDGRARISSRQPLEITGCILQAMMEIIHNHPNWLAILHSAAVTKNDQALLLAGSSGSGKTTLTAHLSASGYGYAADDVSALIAPDGLLAPFPVPQSLKQGSWEPLSHALPELANISPQNMWKGEIKYLPAPANTWEQEPCPVQALLFPTYDASAPAELTPLRPLDALQRLLNDRVWLGYPMEIVSLKTFLSWLESKPAYALRYNDLPAAHALIDDLVR